MIPEARVDTDVLTICRNVPSKEMVLIRGALL